MPNVLNYDISKALHVVFMYANDTLTLTSGTRFSITIYRDKGLISDPVGWDGSQFSYKFEAAQEGPHSIDSSSLPNIIIVGPAGGPVGPDPGRLNDDSLRDEEGEQHG